MSRYQLQRALGRGSYAKVAAALDTHTGNTVAIKYLRSQDREDLARFVREALVLHTLDHPGIVKVLDTGADGNSPYIVMELLEGMTVERLARKKKLTVRQILGIAAKVAEALDYAHAKGVVHRDVKPANVFVTVARDIKLMDFGIARFMQMGASVTAEGVFLGTHEFIAPEVARGARAGPASDLYALASMTYLLIAGETPFPSDDPLKSLMARIESEPRPLDELATDLDPAVVALVMSGLTRDPEQRASVAAFGAEARRLR